VGRDRRRKRQYASAGGRRSSTPGSLPAPQEHLEHISIASECGWTRSSDSLVHPQATSCAVALCRERKVGAVAVEGIRQRQRGQQKNGDDELLNHLWNQGAAYGEVRKKFNRLLAALVFPEAVKCVPSLTKSSAPLQGAALCP